MSHSRALCYAAALGLALSGAPAAAEPLVAFSGISAGKLATLCREHTSLHLDGCGGYIFGVFDALAGKSVFCPPYNPDSGNEQIEAVVTKYLKDHPEQWNKAADFVVSEALRDTFPCRSRK